MSRYKNHECSIAYYNYMTGEELDLVIKYNYNPDYGVCTTTHPEAIDCKFDPYWVYVLFHDKRYIGNIVLLRRKDKLWETHCSDFPDEYKGIGLGFLLYNFVIKHALHTKKIPCSSHNTSPSASKIWNTLAQTKFNIFKGKNLSIVLGEKIQ